MKESGLRTHEVLQGPKRSGCGGCLATIECAHVSAVAIDRKSCVVAEQGECLIAEESLTPSVDGV